MTDAELLERMQLSEGNFLERKLQGSANEAELKKTLVAFANSISGEQEAVLYIGVSDDRKQVHGVTDANSLQRTVRRVCKDICYPPIENVECRVLSKDGKEVLAVVVRENANRPHFSGHAYVRVGSESITASKEMFEDLIASRLEKPRIILKMKGQVITVQTLGKTLGDTEVLGRSFRASYNCRVEECTPHHVTFTDLATGKRLNEPLSYVELSSDTERNRPMLIVEKIR